MRSVQLTALLESIDAANREDPHHEAAEGIDYPKELLYSRRMWRQLEEFAPDASEALQIAARAQHIRRWEIPRSRYPKNRSGYLEWRRELGRFHAEQTAHLMTEAGYDADSISRVQSLLMKKDIKRDSDMQTLEDVICLVFLRYYLEDFAARQDKDKLTSIIRKTWNKMSARGRQEAIRLDLPPKLAVVIEAALADPG